MKVTIRMVGRADLVRFVEVEVPDGRELMLDDYDVINDLSNLADEVGCPWELVGPEVADPDCELATFANGYVPRTYILHRSISSRGRAMPSTQTTGCDKRNSARIGLVLKQVVLPMWRQVIDVLIMKGSIMIVEDNSDVTLDEAIARCAGYDELIEGLQTLGNRFITRNGTPASVVLATAMFGDYAAHWGEISKAALSHRAYNQTRKDAISSAVWKILLDGTGVEVRSHDDPADVAV